MIFTSRPIAGKSHAAARYLEVQRWYNARSANVEPMYPGQPNLISSHLLCTFPTMFKRRSCRSLLLQANYRFGRRVGAAIGSVQQQPSHFGGPVNGHLLASAGARARTVCAPRCKPRHAGRARGRDHDHGRVVALGRACAADVAYGARCNAVQALRTLLPIRVMLACPSSQSKTGSRRLASATARGDHLTKDKESRCFLPQIRNAVPSLSSLHSQSSLSVVHAVNFMTSL